MRDACHFAQVLLLSKTRLENVKVGQQVISLESFGWNDDKNVLGLESCGTVGGWAEEMAAWPVICSLCYKGKQSGEVVV